MFVTAYTAVTSLKPAPSMDRLVARLLLCYITAAPKIDKLFGLSEFSFRDKRIKVLTLSSCAIRFSFIVAYPISCVKTLNFFHRSDSDVTYYARNSTFAFNWLLLLIILGGKTTSSDYQRDILSMFRKLIKLQSLNDNLILLLRCTLKDAVIFAMLFRVTYGKYSRHASSHLGMWERHLWVFLFLPNVVMTLASNRIYVANAVVKHYLMKIARDLKSTAPNRAMNINFSAINYRRVHRVFTRFNGNNAINLLAILAYCLFHIVYEVCR